MDKIALSKRLSGFSEVFKKDTKFARDLKAMSMVIENLPEDKFASLIIEAEDAKAEDAKAEDKKSEETKEAAKKPAEEKAEEKPAEEKAEEEAEEKGESEEAEETEKSAGLYWNKQASEAVLSFLKKDVIGEEVKSFKSASAEPVPAAKLPVSQAPDGKGDKPAPTLKKDQVPHISEVLKSNMVEKSHGAVRKEASESETKFISEGIELTASMDEVDLDSAEMKKLSQLFG